MAVSYQLENFIRILESWGVADVLLPFILIFTIIFAVLQRTNILGEGKKNFNVVVSLVISLSVIIPHVLGTYPAGLDVIEILNEILPQVALIAVVFLLVLILAGIMGAKIVGEGFGGVFVIVAVIAVLTILGGSLGWWESAWFYNFFGEDTISVVVMLLVFGIIIWFITSESNGGAEKAGEGVKKFLRFIMGKN